MEMGLFPLIARPALMQMQQAQGLALSDAFVAQWMGYATAAFLIGAAGGGVVFGWLGDRIGRVRAMAASILVYSLFTGLIYFAQEPWHLCVVRFIAALGMGGEWSLGIALVMEVWPEKHRPLMAGIIGAAANVGFALIAVFAIFFKVTIDSWRWVALIGAAPALLTFGFRLFVPESEKWQAAVKASPTKIRPLQEIFGPQLWRTTLIATALTSVALIGTWGSVQWLPLWADKMAGAADPRQRGGPAWRPASEPSSVVWPALGSVVLSDAAQCSFCSASDRSSPAPSCSAVSTVTDRPSSPWCLSSAR
jgi:MFS family permease